MLSQPFFKNSFPMFYVYNYFQIKLSFFKSAKKKKRVCLSRMEPQSGPLKMLGVTAAGEAAGLGTERRHDKDTPCREPESENQPKTKPKGKRGCI